MLDAAEMHAAMFALGYVSEFNHGHAQTARAQKSIDTSGLGTHTEEGIEGVRLEQFREIMRGSFIGRTGLDEIRMTFEAIVGASTAASASASATESSAGGQWRGAGGQRINFENLRRACLL